MGNERLMLNQMKTLEERLALPGKGNYFHYCFEKLSYHIVRGPVERAM